MDWNSIIITVIKDLAMLAIPALAALVGKLIMNAIKAQKNAHIITLAEIAVHWAEDQVASGKKLDAAAHKLSDLTKGKLTYLEAQTLVAATYAKLTGALDPLPPAPAASVSTAS